MAHSQEKAIMALVDSQIGNFGRPAQCPVFCRNCQKRDPKNAAQHDPGDLRRTRSWRSTTIDDPASLDQIRQAMEE